MRYVGAFGRFWYDFIIGDDPIIALLAVAAVGATALAAHHGLAGWACMVAFVAAALAVTVLRALRSRSRSQATGTG